MYLRAQEELGDQPTLECTGNTTYLKVRYFLGAENNSKMLWAKSYSFFTLFSSERYVIYEIFCVGIVSISVFFTMIQ